MKKEYIQPSFREVRTRTELSFCASGVGGTAPDFDVDDYTW